MARLVTIECDPTEVRIAVGSTGLTGIAVEHVLCAPLKLDPKEDLLNNPKTTDVILGLLKQAGVRSGNAVFCIGRSNIELRAITLPTTDRNELPDMVRFAAQRQFANAGDSWPIDYALMPSHQSNSTDCMAASINPAVLDRLHKMMESVGLSLTKVVLRPMTSAVLAVAKQPALATSPALLLELFDEEADMAVIDQGAVVFMRNVRFSQSIDNPTSLPALIGEVKRTMIAAASQRENIDIEQIRIWGSTAQHSERCTSLTEALGVNTESIDAFDLLDVSQSVRAQAAGKYGKFASTLGALLSPQVSEQLIDFVNPRKREEVKKPLAKYAIAGSAAAAVLICGYVWQRMNNATLDAEIARLKAAISSNEESLKISDKKLADWNKIQTFLQGDHQWLDELEYLSQHAANADRAIFGVTTFMNDLRSSSISTKFITSKREDVPDFLEAFRDPQHEVRSTGVNTSQDKTGVFPVAADVNIRIAPHQVADPRLGKKKSTDKPMLEEASPPIESQVQSPPVPKGEIDPSTSPSPVENDIKEGSQPESVPGANVDPSPSERPATEDTSEPKSSTETNPAPETKPGPEEPGPEEPGSPVAPVSKEGA